MALSPTGPFKSAAIPPRREQQSRSKDEYLDARQQRQLLKRTTATKNINGFYNI
jgi:hypothetical protein